MCRSNFSMTRYTPSSEDRRLSSCSGEASCSDAMKLGSAPRLGRLSTSASPTQTDHQGRARARDRRRGGSRAAKYRESVNQRFKELEAKQADHDTRLLAYMLEAEK